jgi:hypothetical protein
MTGRRRLLTAVLFPFPTILSLFFFTQVVSIPFSRHNRERNAAYTSVLGAEFPKTEEAIVLAYVTESPDNSGAASFVLRHFQPDLHDNEKVAPIFFVFTPFESTETFHATGRLHIESANALGALHLKTDESILAWSLKPWPTQEIYLAPASVRNLFSDKNSNFPVLAVYDRHAALSVRLSPTMKLSEAKLVALTMGSDEAAKGLRFRLSSPSFAISGTETAGDWEWLIHPAATGTFKLFLEPVFDGKKKAAKIDWIIPPDLEKAITIETNGTLILSIQVLTSLGLTAVQDAWLKAVGTLIGVLGTLFVYPFWKKYLESKVSLGAAAAAAAGVTGDTSAVQGESGSQEAHQKPQKSGS